MEDIKIGFNKNGIKYTLAPSDDYLTDNSMLPYDLAELIRILIKESDVNENIVIKNLIDDFGYTQTEEE